MNHLKKIILTILICCFNLVFAQINKKNVTSDITSSNVKFFPVFKMSHHINLEQSGNDGDKRMIQTTCGKWTRFFDFDEMENYDELKVTWKDVYQLNVTSKNIYKKRELPDGDWTFTYPDGKTMATGHFNMGKPEGKWLYYDDDGKTEAEENYINGLPDGIWKIEDDDKINSFKNGVAHGKWSLSQGHRVFIFNYADGKIDGEQIFGGIFKLNFKNDELNGEIIYYNILNPYEIKLKGNFLNGVPNGEWDYYAISKPPDEEKDLDLVHCYYSKQYPTSVNNSTIYKKIIYSKDKISEYEIFDNNTDLKLVSEIFLEYNNLHFSFFDAMLHRAC